MTGPQLLLPDISEFQPGAIMTGIKKINGGAAIIRAAYGTEHPDAAFASHRAAAAAAQFAFVGIYQYIVADQDITAQARAFMRIIRVLRPHEVAIADVEEGEGSQAHRAQVWCGQIDLATGRNARTSGQAWVYSGDDYAREHGLGPLFASPRHTWVAAYGPAEPALGHTLWQCTDGKAGIHITDWPGAGRCDTNLYHGTLAQLAALTPAAYPA